MATKTASKGCGCAEKPTCEPQCVGLECLERPRFFSGQLLTEEELNDLTAYLLAKNRLHNLHMHGWGVVCGLEVSCHPDCKGWVRVAPGYAIDSCGNDVIVCCEEEIDVIKRIRECRAAKRRKTDCRPAHRRDTPGSNLPLEEHWCLKLRYVEKETQPSTALRRDTSCSCGCKTPAGCTCGTHKTDSGLRRGAGKSVAACEPTRILESYCLELCEADEDFCAEFRSSGERAWTDKLQACVETLQRTLQRFPTNSTLQLGDVAFEEAGMQTRFGANVSTASQLQDSFCRVHEALLDLLRRSPGFLHCSLLDRLRELECPVPLPGQSASAFAVSIRPQVRDLLSILFVYLFDCICNALLPPCAPCCAEEDPLIIACMTVRGDEIVEICNYSCRRWAGMFPPSIGGVWIGPLMPIFGRLLDFVCCGDFIDRILGTFRDSNVARGAADWTLQDNFAAPRAVRSRAADVVSTHIAVGAEEEPPVHLAAFVGQPVATAVSVARERGVEMRVRTVDHVPLAESLDTFGRARRGERLVAFANRKGDVLGFAREGSANAAVVDQFERITTLETEVAELKKRLGGTGPAR
jgi:hypothetical protein